MTAPTVVSGRTSTSATVTRTRPGGCAAPYWLKVSTGLTPPLESWIPKRFVTAPPDATVPGRPASVPTGFRGDAWLEVHFVDVGQGDAVWIKTFDDNVAANGRYEGKSVIIDGGPDGSDGKNELLRYLRKTVPDGSVIDALIISHPHDDHYPGALGVLRHYQVRDYYDAGYPKAGPKWAAFRAEVDAERVGNQPVRQHIGIGDFDTPNWGSEVAARFLYAWPGHGQDSDLSTGNTLENNASVVLRLTYGNHSFLFMGDAEGKERDDAPDVPRFVERRLLASPGATALKSTVLKVAHHGSETSSTLPFVRAVNPDILVVLSGRKNFSTRKPGGTFLPDASTLARYCANNPRLVIARTDQDDDSEGRTASDDADGDHVIVRTNGRDIEVQAFSNGVEISAQACRP